MFKFARKAISAILSVVILIVVFLAGYVYLNAKQADETPSDAIVVLGAAQYDGKPTEVFQNRLDHAKDLYDLGIARHIITVGGKQDGDRFTEAEAGRNYLISLGVPADDIVAAKTGSNTVESMVAVAAVMKKNSWHSVTVSTDPVHVARVVVIAGKLGMSAFPAPTLTGPGTEISSGRVITEMAGIAWFYLAEQWGVD